MCNCSIFSTSCRESKLCEPGLICHSWAGYCCENKSRGRAVNMCHASGAMDTPCNSLRFAKWCFEDFHCRNTPRQKCCPTQCGYKICH
ncbi:hypothetical protein GCK32_020622 [Trichostrongylus colubriformis]|uniref:WAP domain-containing protein n=1 Tax=Trichostrongylus colubriformis TaxID=6319 RepID=A0AAN8IUC1_TRICO